MQSKKHKTAVEEDDISVVGTSSSILSVTTGTPLVEPVAIPAEDIEVDETDEEVEIVIRGGVAAGAGGSGVKAAESGNHTGTPHLKKKHSMNSDRRMSKKQASNCKLTETSFKVIPNEDIFLHPN